MNVLNACEASGRICDYALTTIKKYYEKEVLEILKKFKVSDECYNEVMYKLCETADKQPYRRPVIKVNMCEHCQICHTDFCTPVANPYYPAVCINYVSDGERFTESSYLNAFCTWGL